MMWDWNNAFVALSTLAVVLGAVGVTLSFIAVVDGTINWPRWRTIASLALAVVGTFFVAGLGGFA